MKRVIAAWVMLSHILMIGQPVWAKTETVLVENSRCIKKDSVCVDGPSEKVINGVTVHKECWEYQDRYECLEPNSANFCEPLKQPAAQCEITGQTCLETQQGECLRYTHQYSCDVNLKTLHQGKLPPHVEELEHSHLITAEWDNSQCDPDGRCKAVETQCIEGEETRVINGVPVTQPCWKERRTMQCRTGEDVNECQALESNQKCSFQSERCVFELPDGGCQIQEKTYRCEDKPAGTQTTNSCVDGDFAQTMTSMELAREMQRFYDPNQQRFFNGEPNKCSIKLGGALDGFLGGNCCKTDAEPSKMKDFAIQAGTQIAAQYLLTSVASHYTYTTLTGQAASYLATALSSAGVGTAATGAAAATEGVGALGFSVAPASGGGVFVTFDPVSFGAAIAIMALHQYLKCDQDEILTAMKRKAGLCHYVGSYCGTKAVGACVKKIESQCCYVSKLAKIVNVGGREQLKKGFGSAESPQCEGFTAQEMEQLDFSKLDLADFYQEIYANMDNVTKQGQALSNKGRDSIQNGRNNRVRNYYEH